jgi:hypothetical protein
LDPPGYLVFGPYVPLASDRYRVTIDYRSDAPQGTTAGVFEVVGTGESGDGSVERGRVGRVDLVGTNGEPGSISIEFDGDAVSLWEFRAWWNGGDPIRIDSVRSEPIG